MYKRTQILKSHSVLIWYCIAEVISSYLFLLAYIRVMRILILRFLRPQTSVIELPSMVYDARMRTGVRLLGLAQKIYSCFVLSRR